MDRDYHNNMANSSNDAELIIIIDENFIDVKVISNVLNIVVEPLEVNVVVNEDQNLDVFPVAAPTALQGEMGLSGYSGIGLSGYSGYSGQDGFLFLVQAIQEYLVILVLVLVDIVGILENQDTVVIPATADIQVTLVFLVILVFLDMLE